MNEASEECINEMTELQKQAGKPPYNTPARVFLHNESRYYVPAGSASNSRFQ